MLPMPRAAYLPRHVDGRIAQAMETSPIVLLDGPRGVGKTTTARRLVSSSVLFPDDIGRIRADAPGYLASLDAPVLIDEWQLAGTDLLWTLKRIVDDAPQPGRFILTGSSEPATYGPTYPLTGRAVRIVMRPMTTSELMGLGDRPTFLESMVSGESPAATAGRPVDFSLEHLGRAGFPAARVMPDAALFLESYAALVAQRGGEEGRDATRLLTTLRVLATLEAQAVPDQRIWESADINKATWKAYDDLLTRTYLVAPSPAFESNRLKRLTSYPKRYLSDVALAMALAKVDAQQLRSDPQLAGRYIESFVMQQLRPQVDAAGGTLFHLRTGAGEHEVDAVVEVGSDVYAFEVKHATAAEARDAKAVRWLADQLPDRFRMGFVVHTGGDTFPLSDRTWALSIDALTGRA
jgi:uncharacterized protein